MPFQTTLVGLIGFSGVILTLIVNAHISRKALAASESIRRSSLKNAVMAELQQMQEFMLAQARSSNKGESNEFLLASVDEGLDAIFRSNLTQIGSLPPESVKPVLKAYSAYRELLRQIEIVNPPGTRRLERSMMISAQYASIIGKNSEQVASFCEAAIAQLAQQK